MQSWLYWSVWFSAVGVGLGRLYTLELVLTVFDEPLDWLTTLENHLPSTILLLQCHIYSKKPDIQLPFTGYPIQVTTIKNVGRGGLGHVMYILSVRDRPDNPDLVWFSQGGPHRWDLSAAAYTLTRYAFYLSPAHAIFMSLADQPIQCRGQHDGHLFKPDLNELLPVTCAALNLSLDKLCWMYFGEFIVNEAALAQLRFQYSASIKSIILPALQESNDPPMGHVLERLWMTLFANSGSVIVDSPSWSHLLWFKVQLLWA